MSWLPKRPPRFTKTWEESGFFIHCLLNFDGSGISVSAVSFQDCHLTVFENHQKCLIWIFEKNIFLIFEFYCQKLHPWTTWTDMKWDIWGIFKHCAMFLFPSKLSHTFAFFPPTIFFWGVSINKVLPLCIDGTMLCNMHRALKPFFLRLLSFFPRNQYGNMLLRWLY